MKIASGKKWITVIAAVLMVCVCALASAQSYSLGDEADEIATIQTALKKLKLYTGDITGHYGAKTQTAVKTFQKRYGLEDDGIAGEGTIQALYEAAEITYSGSSSSSSASVPSGDSDGVLRQGSRSDAVRTLQEDLKALGYYDGSISGHYGSLTEAAVMKFQRTNGLSPDGVAGTKTLAKIAAARSGSSSGSSSSSSSSSSSGSSSTLRYGVKSDAVRTLQEDLKTLGFYTGSVTGNFGNLTKEAVYNFQKANNLSADGVAGAKTLSKIATAMAGDTSGSSSGSSSSSGSGSSSSSSSSMTLNTSVTLMNGSSSDEVLKLQKMLTKLGYYSGNQTGNFGDKTEEAVVAFQKAMGLTADGIAGKNTLAAINAKYNGSSSSSGSSSSGSGSSGVSANNVRYENFYNWRTKYANGQYCTVYDPATGYSWTLRIMTKDAHMDAEPLTAEDTAIMNKAFGGVTTWTPKPVWVTFSDGKTYLGSTHNVPHSPSHLSNNNFDGHLCVHFPISMEKAKEIGPYATSHQETINEAWDKILAQYR